MGGEEEGLFRILVATDNHLGYAEKHPERGNDSFNSFEEVLQLAVEHDVDFILLGGDLFHENKPSRHCQVRCMDLLRKYTFGDRPVHFNILSDPAVNFPHTKRVNYLDPNLNVAIPVFSIHGNHDDPSGLGLLCPLEMLSSAGLINYFGRICDLSDVKISPILMEKGSNKLALYGLCSVKDERLHRLFVENKVKMLRPKESLNEWFNLMVLHQNRVKRGPSNYLPETFLDPFLDLIIWGHEHDCIQEIRQSHQDFHILQPGSSVATSLIAGETTEKCAFLLLINKNQQFRVDPLPLKTIRPFLFEEIILSEYNIEEEANRISGKRNAEKINPLDILLKSRGRGGGRNRNTTTQLQSKVNPVEVFIEHRVRELIKDSKKLLTGHPKQPTLPLIRVRVIYHEENQIFNVCRFGYKFEGLVANTEDLVIFSREKSERGDDEKKPSLIPGGLDDNLINVDDVNNTVEQLVEEIFNNESMAETAMSLLTERGMSTAVSAFVQKEDRNAISNMLDYQVQRMQEHILSLNKDYDNPEDLEADILAFRAERSKQANLQAEEDEVLAAIKVSSRASQNNPAYDSDDNGNDMDDETIEDVSDNDDLNSTSSSSGRGSRGRGRGRGNTSTSRSTTRGSRARGSRGRGRLF